MRVYIVYSWYADSEPDSGYIDRKKDLFAVYDSQEKANKAIESKPLKFNGMFSEWFTIEAHTVR